MNRITHNTTNSMSEDNNANAVNNVNTICRMENIKGFVIISIAIAIIVIACVTVSDTMILTLCILGIALGAFLVAIPAYARYHEVVLCCRVLCAGEDYGDSTESIDISTDNENDPIQLDIDTDE